jgi:hypothetical protein
MRKLIVFALATIVLFSFKADKTEEGMFPLSHLNRLDLKKAGLEIEPSEIYNEENPSLVNALVRLGGCTGSFISDQGLIITNHHCVFSSVAAASSPENNYLENGFYAATSEEEIKTTLPCKITLSFEDVSSQVLDGVDEIGDALEKKSKIAENIKALETEEQNKYPNLSVEVSEMLTGKSYTLFRYKTLNDVRLVYVPPKNIGKFGGETDNWEWPRHNGDFSIVRAYENGKPYNPDKHLDVNASGTKDGDFTFILGYPGRTYRNQPAEFLTYQNNYVLPIISDWFDFRISAIEEFVGNDVGLQLKYSGTLASLNNVTKNFKGKMQGLRRTNVIEQTKKDQAYLKEFASSNSDYKDYVPLFERNERLYDAKFKLITDFLYLNQLFGNGIYSPSAAFVGYANKINQMPKAEAKSYVAENQEKLKEDLGGFRSLANKEALELTLFQELFYRLSQSQLTEVQQVFEGLDVSTKATSYATAKELWVGSPFAKLDKFTAKLENPGTKLFKYKNKGFLKFVNELNVVFASLQQEMRKVNAEIDAIIPRLNDLEQEVNGGKFIPDANGTLRFTYGYVKGYEPEDAVVYSPFTTTEGILQKNEGTDNKDYFLQPEYIEKIKQTQPADVLKHPKHNAVVVAFLYNMDTTGGNSGSPIMDSKGRLVGVNFDRAYSATINDYAWNESYSRSIGVDIRYVLYVMKYFGEADEVLAEMGVTL